MGHGIAQVFAAANHSVKVTDPDKAVLDSLIGRVSSIFELLELDETNLANMEAVDTLEEAVADADIVIEAAPEKLDLKQTLFDELIGATRKDCILASNTSGLPIGRIAEKASEPERIVGTHFWNPPHLLPLVEVVQGEKTDPVIIEKMIKLLNSIGKSAVHARKDIPGFIGNRLQHALKREAIALVENGVCDAETVDKVVRDGFGMRLAVMGPLENSDLVGLNLTLDIHSHLLMDLDNSRKPQKLLREKVASGQLGMHTGKGFREWSADEAEARRAEMHDHLVAAAKSRMKFREKK